IQPIEHNVTVAGRLTEALLMPGTDGPIFECYAYPGLAGETIQINLASEDFDTYLFAGPMPAAGCELDVVESLQSNDDFGASTDSQLTLTLSADGPVLVVATSYEGNSV